MAMADSIRSSIMPMESSLENSDHISVEDMKLKSNYGDEKEGDHVMYVKQEENSRNQPSSMEDQLRSTKFQIGEVREENERLKKLLCKIVKDYESLQKHFSKVVKGEEEQKSTKIKPIHQENEDPELISLSLGRSSSEPRKEEKKSSNLSGENEELNNNNNNNKGLLSLGLDFKFDADSSATMNNNNSNNNNNNNLSSESNSFDEEQKPKEGEPTETWPPSKVLKTTISADDEVLQQTQMKKTRVSVRTRCEAPTMNDGCQWRKYGQKIAKGNPCPRAYYRCTVSPTCPVRKQVQRCAEDMSILITTYEGTHNHPLPLSATAMASTTSAAASMLQSHSSTSQPGTSSSISAPSSISNIQNFTFSTQNNNTLIKPPNQFYFPNSSISTNNSHPTITLDLTTPITNKSPKCFNFSSSSLDSNSTFQSPWTHPTGYPTYNRYNNNGSYMTDQTIAAATKVITLDPNFRSALAAAITSFVGNNNNINNYNNNNNPGGNLGDHHHHQSLKFNYPISSQSGIINGCGSSYLLNNKSAPNNTNNLRSQQQQQGSLVLFPPPLQPFSPSKTSSGSPANSRDNNKAHEV